MTARHKLWVTLLLIFLLAVGVRLLVWQQNRAAIEQVMTQLTLTYKADARVLARGDWRLFVRGQNPPSDANVLAHPPGYPLLAALLFAFNGESDAALRLWQLLCDAASVIFLFLIARELLSQRVAVMAGVMAALSPQLAYNSLLLLPDSLAVLPILMSVYLFIRAAKEERGWIKLLAAGALLGLSCWLRPNALALPLFMAALTPFVFRRGQRWRAAVALAGAGLLLIAPLTLRNRIVFRSFVPVSLGSGVTMLEGIADYDRKGELGLPQTDMDVLQQEARESGRADYAGSLYNPDGIERERARRARGLAVIRAHPLWFASVMARRAASMLRMERVPVIAGSPFQPASGFPLKAVQKLFITALMLPLFLIGVGLLFKERNLSALFILLVVPVYYLCVQSLLHTEYRYLLALQYFLLIFVAVTLDRAVKLIAHAKAQRLKESN
ncbi:MAG: glycosyltransferase family 39 protein [Acidobacteria bacterium]|nr:glycosyltransferase family 39 protein [Acidobacteriota bacterium]